MYAKHVLIGNVGNDPELRYTPQGQAVCNFSLAVNRKWTDAQSQSHEETTWYRVATWGKLAEVCGQYVKKGRPVLVESDRLKVDAYLKKDGAAAASLEVTALTVKFLGGRDGHAEPGVKPEDARPGSDSDLDIPF